MLMALHPDIQRQAQAEVDKYIEKGCLPSMRQLDQLKYLNALLKEVLRFAPTGPLGESFHVGLSQVIGN